MRILSWNVNSIRFRQRSLARVLRTHQPDVVCLQETKVVDALFPRERFAELGYGFQYISGQKGYHGVAVLSRIPFERPRVKIPSRHIYVTLPTGVELHNIYAPAGGPLPDPEKNPKFQYKLDFYRATTRWFRRRGLDEAVLVGDLNIAPLPTDVWSHQQLKRVVTHTPVEVKAMERLAATRQWVDAVRHFVPESKKLYTWWSYRARDWRRVDKGRRLDHAWVTPGLREALRKASVLKGVRGFRLPSDHAPLVLEVDL